MSKLSHKWTKANEFECIEVANIPRAPLWVIVLHTIGLEDFNWTLLELDSLSFIASRIGSRICEKCVTGIWLAFYHFNDFSPLEFDTKGILKGVAKLVHFTNLPSGYQFHSQHTKPLEFSDKLSNFTSQRRRYEYCWLSLTSSAFDGTQILVPVCCVCFRTSDSVLWTFLSFIHGFVSERIITPFVYSLFFSKHPERVDSR